MLEVGEGKPVGGMEDFREWKVRDRLGRGYEFRFGHGRREKVNRRVEVGLTAERIQRGRMGVVWTVEMDEVGGASIGTWVRIRLGSGGEVSVRRRIGDGDAGRGIVSGEGRRGRGNKGKGRADQRWRRGEENGKSGQRGGCAEVVEMEVERRWRGWRRGSPEAAAAA